MTKERKMKVHKIRGVDKNVCCAEQMIAHNIAFRCEYLKKKYQASTGVGKAEIIVYARNFWMEEFERLHGWKRFNRDAVFCALNAGLPAYLDDPKYTILTTYADVGKAFPILYPIE